MLAKLAAAANWGDVFLQRELQALAYNRSKYDADGRNQIFTTGVWNYMTAFYQQVAKVPGVTADDIAQWEAVMADQGFVVHARGGASLQQLGEAFDRREVLRAFMRTHDAAFPTDQQQTLVKTLNEVVHSADVSKRTREILLQPSPVVESALRRVRSAMPRVRIHATPGATTPVRIHATPSKLSTPERA